MTDSKALKATLLSVAFSATVTLITVLGTASILNSLPDRTDVETVLIILSPALLFPFLIRSYRGAIVFGSLLVLVTACSWLALVSSDYEFRAFYVFLGAFAGIVLTLFGTVVDRRWRSHENL